MEEERAVQIKCRFMSFAICDQWSAIGNHWADSTLKATRGVQLPGRERMDPTGYEAAKGKWAGKHRGAPPRLLAMWWLCAAYVLSCGSDPHEST